MNNTNVSCYKMEMFDQVAEYMSIKFFLLRKFLLAVCNIHKMCYKFINRKNVCKNANLSRKVYFKYFMKQLCCINSMFFIS